MPKTRYKPLDQMTPFARRVTQYMWHEHEPPLSVSDLAAMTGITSQAIWDWLRKDVFPAERTLQRLAAGTSLRLAELYTLCGYEMPTRAALDELEQWVARDRRLLAPMRDTLNRTIAELRKEYIDDEGRDCASGALARTTSS